ncbi:hypothetical protein FOA52_015668 [Chlamydomonas sp. UWO 241]|nr:hypothetical protein FOA52_015668 [Chlamydomonas sp. UWO 241]
MCALRVLFITLEFSSGTFSGNGIYAQSQVRALAGLGHQVFVISARPHAHGTEPGSTQGAVRVVEVPVSSWGRLCAAAPYAEFATGGASPEVATAVAAFAPDVAMGVDWSSLPLYRALAQQLAQQQAAVPPLVYLNYRVFSRTAQGPELELVSRLEREAMQEAVLTVALSRSDSQYLSELLASAGTGEGTGAIGGCGGEGAAEGAAGVAARHQAPAVLLPALREDMRTAGTTSETSRGDAGSDGGGGGGGGGGRCDGGGGGGSGGCGAGGGDGGGSVGGDCSAEAGGGAAAAAAAAAQSFASSRPYLACCVRLSPEKEPHRFVELVEALAALPGGLDGVTPLLVAGTADDQYARLLKARLRAAAPSSVVLESFLGPQQLAELYGKTRLNVHPATYDAFGMTIIEAASQGAPSLVHDGNGAVGATDLLSTAAGEVLLAHLTDPPAALAARVLALLDDPKALLRVAAAAAAKARSWGEGANAGALIALVRGALRRAAEAAGIGWLGGPRLSEGQGMFPCNKDFYF